MARRSKTYNINEFYGLDNKHSPESLYNANHTKTYLAAAKNVDITSSNQVRRRDGFTLKDAGEYHSLWASFDLALAVKNNALVKISDDLDITTLTDSTFASSPLSYADTGAVVYVSDGKAIGKTDGETFEVLAGAGTYDLTDRSLSPANDGEIYDKPVPGYPIAWMFGRLWCATKDAVFYSRAYEPERFNLMDNYLDMPDVTMLGCVDDGYYIGTSERVYFVEGGNPNTPTRVNAVCPYGAIKGTCISIDASQLYDETLTGKALAFESKRGKVIALNGGRILEPSAKHVSPDPSDIGSMFLREYNGESQLVSSLANKDGQGSSMRATDYAEAEIIRKQ
jgi:hypothetical protein